MSVVSSLLWIKKARAKDKTYTWADIWVCRCDVRLKYFQRKKKVKKMAIISCCQRGKRKKKKRRRGEKEEKKGRKGRGKGRKGEKEGRKTKGKAGKGGYEDSVGVCVGRFFFLTLEFVATGDFEKKSPHAVAFLRSFFTGKVSPTQPLHNPSSYVPKLPLFTELFYCSRNDNMYIDMKI